MLQNGDTWGTTPRITVDTTQKAVEPKSGLASSRWASSHGKPTPVVLAASTANMEHPEQGSHKVDYQAADVNPDLKMDNGFSFTVTPSRISKMSTFNAPTAQSEDEFWGGAVSQHQFDSEVAMVDGDGDVVMMDLNDPGTIMMVDQVARDERQAETGGYADVCCFYLCILQYKSEIANRCSGNLASDPQSLALALAIHPVCL